MSATSSIESLALREARPMRGMIPNTLLVARRELRDAMRSRWFVLYSLAFVLLGLGVSYISAAGAGSSGLSGYGRTTAGLINLVLLVVPLMALTAGAGTIASDRERGMLAYMLAQPISRWEVLLGKYLGCAAALASCIGLGLGVCTGLLAWKGAGTNPSSLAWLAGLTLALALAMLSVGMLISVLARRANVAIGTAVFAWLVLVFITDLGLMAGAITLRLRVQEIFWAAIANPLQVFKMWSLYAADATLDVLGPVGLYAGDTYGRGVHGLFAGAMLLWIFLPLTAAGVIFARRSPL